MKIYIVCAQVIGDYDSDPWIETGFFKIEDAQRFKQEQKRRYPKWSFWHEEVDIS